MGYIQCVCVSQAATMAKHMEMVTQQGKVTEEKKRRLEKDRRDAIGIGQPDKAEPELKKGQEDEDDDDGAT